MQLPVLQGQLAGFGHSTQTTAGTGGSRINCLFFCVFTCLTTYEDHVIGYLQDHKSCKVKIAIVHFGKR